MRPDGADCEAGDTAYNSHCSQPERQRIAGGSRCLNEPNDEHEEAYAAEFLVELAVSLQVAQEFLCIV